MNHLQRVAVILNRLLSQHSPERFNAGWIRKHAPGCYSSIRKRIRSEVGSIDWDKITRALEPQYQRLWTPLRKRNTKPYRDNKEIDLILNRYRNKLYVFVALVGAADFRIRDQIAIALVRIAQHGNLSARAKLVELLRYAIDEWIDSSWYLSRWRGREDEIRAELEGCIRRYRYSGSFFRYVFRTLEYAGRGVCSLHACSLDEPIASDSRQRRIDNVIHDSETNTAGLYKPKREWFFDSESQLDG
jgi:hypothetical protein